MDEPTTYDPNKYPRVAVTVDVVALTIRDDKLCALLVKRDKEPFAGKWALPGTFLRPDEDADFAARRGPAQKAGIYIRHVEQLGTYSRADRDPRMRIVSVAYLSFGPVDEAQAYVANEMSVGAQWCPIFDGVALAFDHATILDDGLRRAQDKLEYTTLATKFLPPEFTMRNLMSVYEIVWNRKIDRGNFYRKVKAAKGFIEPTGEFLGKASMKNTKGSAHSLLYRAGSASMVYPPIRREREVWE